MPQAQEVYGDKQIEFQFSSYKTEKRKKFKFRCRKEVKRLKSIDAKDKLSCIHATRMCSGASLQGNSNEQWLSMNREHFYVQKALGYRSVKYVSLWKHGRG